MSKPKTENTNEEVKASEQPVFQPFFFPTHNMSIMASTLEEAKKELQKRLNPTL